jgi:putative tricarboxylic transport membrane protein
MGRVSMRKADIWVALILIPICLYVFYESAKWPKEALIGAPTLIPRGVSACLLLAGGLLLVRALRGKADELEVPLVGANRRRVVLIGLLTGAYAGVVAYAGFLISTFIYLLLFGLIVGERRLPRLLLFAVLVPVAIYLVFSTVFNVPLPEGWLR